MANPRLGKYFIAVMSSVPKYTGQVGEDPNGHLQNFRIHFRLVTGVDVMEPGEGTEVAALAPDIIDFFVFTLTENARAWFGSKYGDLQKEDKTLVQWGKIRESFKTDHSVLGKTEEQKELAIRKIKWEPDKQSFEKFLLTFRIMMDEIPEVRKLTVFLLAMPRELYPMIMDCKDIESMVKSVTRAIDMGMISELQRQDTQLNSSSIAGKDAAMASFGDASQMDFTRLMQGLRDFLSSSNASENGEQEQDYRRGRGSSYGWKGGYHKYSDYRQQQDSDGYWGGQGSRGWRGGPWKGSHNSMQECQVYYCTYCQKNGHSTKRCKFLRKRFRDEIEQEEMEPEENDEVENFSDEIYWEDYPELSS